MKRITIFLVMFTLCGSLFAGDYIRVSKDENNEVTSLDISINTYEKDDLQVDLVGVVHIADKNYYEKLNEEFEKYDVVLYELVSFDGKVPDPNYQHTNKISKVLSQFKTIMNRVIDLDDQLKCVDYQKDNFVHADMSPIEIKLAMDENGDNLLTIGLEGLANFVRESNIAKRNPEENDKGLLDVLDQLTDIDAMKSNLAQELAKSTDLPIRSLEKLIVDARNEKALKIMDQQISKGKKKIAIFYGAAHMKDFHERLTSGERGFKRTNTRWLKAWDFRD